MAPSFTRDAVGMDVISLHQVLLFSDWWCLMIIKEKSNYTDLIAGEPGFLARTSRAVVLFRACPGSDMLVSTHWCYFDIDTLVLD